MLRKQKYMQAFKKIDPIEVKALDGTLLKVVENFKYLGAWSESTEKDLMRKALAWNSCHKLRKV